MTDSVYYEMRDHVEPPATIDAAIVKHLVDDGTFAQVGARLTREWRSTSALAHSEVVTRTIRFYRALRALEDAGFVEQKREEQVNYWRLSERAP